MHDHAATPVPTDLGGLGLLLRMKMRMLANRFDQASRESPIKLVATVVFVVIIWFGLYVLFDGALAAVGKQRLEAIIAIPLVFHFFFIALAVMLAFSNAILSYGSLYGRGESAFLMAAPVRPRHIVTLKYFESLFYASWSLLLLGLPLMVAMAHRSGSIQTGAAAWPFYAMFMCFFLLFVPIPAAVGLLAAWAAARYFPRSRVRVLGLALVVIIAIGGVYVFQAARETATGSEAWLKSFYRSMALLQGALLPNQWIAEGIVAAREGRYADARFYLAILGANALFIGWVAVAWVSSRLTPAYARANSAGRRRINGAARGSAFAHAIEWLFFYLPRPLRLIAQKDIRCFLRDPVQWSQTLILMGLLGLYVYNLPNLGGGFGSTSWVMLISFLNLTAVSLILATFTSRFVYPLVSLEGQQFWLLGLLPIRRERILWAKFAYATTITLAAGWLVTLLAIRGLTMRIDIALAQLAIISSVCVGLCGTAVGFGAVWPMFNERNAARVASGFGGTINLIISVLLVVATLVGTAIVGYFGQTTGREIDRRLLAALVVYAVVVNGIAAGAALRAGSRRLRNKEF